MNLVAGEVGQVHYLPHRPVIREDKETTKIRAVFVMLLVKLMVPHLTSVSTQDQTFLLEFLTFL
jgi:hypothetical protein